MYIYKLLSLQEAYIEEVKDILQVRKDHEFLMQYNDCRYLCHDIDPFIWGDYVPS